MCLDLEKDLWENTGVKANLAVALKSQGVLRELEKHHTGNEGQAGQKDQAFVLLAW